MTVSSAGKAAREDGFMAHDELQHLGKLSRLVAVAESKATGALWGRLSPILADYLHAAARVRR